MQRKTSLIAALVVTSGLSFATAVTALADEANPSEITPVAFPSPAAQDTLEDLPIPALDAVPNSGSEMLRKGQVGFASYYGREFQGRRTASGHAFDPEAMTAAHRHLPLGTQVRITNLANGRSYDATINDRGPFVHGRVIDVSRGLAERLGFLRAGIARVKIEVLGWEPVKSLRAAMDPSDTPRRRARAARTER